MNNERCDIIIPVFNRPDLTRDCLESLYGPSAILFNLILIDNASADDTKRYLEDFKSSNKNVTLVRNEENLGWVRAVNQGLRISKSRYVCIMNNDTVVKTANWLSRLIEVAESEEDIGLVNPRFEIKNDIWMDRPFIEVDFCRGYCILIKRKVIEKIGMLDESYGLGYYDDDDYSVRAIRRGFRPVRANGVMVEHIRDSTFSTILEDDTRRTLHEKNKLLFYSRWGRRLKLVFILTKGMDRAILSDALFSLARRQHRIYLWNTTGPYAFRHINIREGVYPRVFCGPLFFLFLCMDSLRKKTKHYDIVFVDDAKLNSLLSGLRPAVYCADIEKDMASIDQIVDSKAKV